MQKKMKIPKMSNRNTVENHFGEERMPLRHKKVGMWVFKKGFKIWETKTFAGLLLLVWICRWGTCGQIRNGSTGIFY